MSRPEFRPDHYKKAQRSDSNPPNCVHVARGMGWVVIRDTKQEFDSDTDHKFGFLTAAFDAFQAAIRAADLRTALIPAGALDGCEISIVRTAENVSAFRSVVPQAGLPANAALVFTDSELEAFFDGVHNREFDVDGEYVAHTADCSADCSVPNHVALAVAV